MSQEQKFAQFCIASGYLNMQKLQLLQQRKLQLKQQGHNANLIQIIAQELKWNADQLKSVYESVLALDTTGMPKDATVCYNESQQELKAASNSLESVSPQKSKPGTDSLSATQTEIELSDLQAIPPEYREDVLWGIEILNRGFASDREVNKALQEKWKGQQTTAIAQIMMRSRLLSVNHFMEIKKVIDSLSPDDLQKRHAQGPKLYLHIENGIPVIEKKAGFQKIGRYEVVRELGRGGMGIVYAAKDAELNKMVAIKVLLTQVDASEGEIERFKREAQLAASLTHPHIISVHEVGVHDGNHFFVMDYIEGLSLDEFIEASKLKHKKIIALIRSIADALAFAHSKNVVHRDIKPQNILVDATSGKPFLTDFGLAKNVKTDKKLTMSGAILGTPYYMPPEQAQGNHRKIGKHSDVYSLGAVLYEVLVGRAPFSAGSMADMVVAITQQDPIPPRSLVKGLSKDINTITLKCLEKQPKRRYPNAKALTADLSRYLKGEPIHASPASVLYKINKWVMRNKALTALFLLGISVAMASIFLFFLAPGTLAISLSNKKDVKAKITIGNKKISIVKTKKITLNRGFHQVKLEAKDYQTQEFSVNISPRKEITIEKKLVRENGSITISSPLTAIDVALFNIQTRKKTRLVAPLYQYSLPVGDYEAKFSKRNHFPRNLNFTIKKGEITYKDIFLESMVVWRYEASDRADISSIRTADFDQDGELEILFSTKGNFLKSLSLSEQKILWSLEVEKPPINEFDIAIKDYNSDGFLDILMVPSGGMALIDGKNKEAIWKAPNWWGEGFITKDINNDGNDEIISFSQYRGIICSDINKGVKWVIPRSQIRKILGRDLNDMFKPMFLNSHILVYATTNSVFALNVQKGQILWQEHTTQERGVGNFIKSRNKNGRETLIWSISNNVKCMDLNSRKFIWERSYGYPLGIVAADIDNDGVHEIFFQSDQLYCLDATSGKPKWQYNTKNQGSGFTPIVADLENDGHLEVIAIDNHGYLHIVNAHTGKVLNKFYSRFQIRNPIVVDSDGDGILEILFSLDRYIYCIRHTPEKQIQTFDLDPQLYNATPSALDIDNDGKKEIVICNKFGVLYCLDQSLHPIWQKKVGKNTTAPTTTADINGDQISEILLYTEAHILALTNQGEEIWRYKMPEESINSRFPIKVIDLDKDGKVEVISTTYTDGWIVCLNGANGKPRWKKKIHRCDNEPTYVDMDRDGILEILFSPSHGTEVFCLDSKTGESKWDVRFGNPVVGSQIVTKDIDQDGYPEMFLPQIKGDFACVDGKTRRFRWVNRLPTCHNFTPALIDDFDKDGNLEFIVGFYEETLYCLDARTGQEKWQQLDFMNKQRNVDFKIKKFVDINKDNSPDIFTNSSFHSFLFFSGKNGQLLGDIKKFSQVNDFPLFGDFNNDKKMDIVFTNNRSQLIYIKDAIPYLQRFIHKKPRPIKNFFDYNPFVYMAHLNELLNQKKYALLREKKQEYAPYTSSYKHIGDFYEGICAVALKEPQKAIEFFTKSPLFRSKYLLALTYLQQKQEKKGQKAIEQLLTESIIDFENCYQRYSHLWDKKFTKSLRRLIAKITRKSSAGQEMVYGYRYNRLTHQPKQAQRFLKLSLKYGPRKAKDFAKRVKLFEKEIFDKIDSQDAYHQHNILFILNEALDVLSNYPPFLKKRAIWFLEFDYQTKNSIPDLQKYTYQVKKDRDAHLYLALAYLINGERKKAAETIAKVNKKFRFKKGEFITLFFQGLLAVAQKDKRKAAQSFNQMKELIQKRKAPRDQIWIFNTLLSAFRKI